MSRPAATTDAAGRTASLIGPTLGYAVVGLSAFTLLATGPRALGPSGYSVLAVAWTIVTIVGVGLALPAEQVVNRHVAAGRDRRDYHSVQRRLLTLPVVLLVLPLASALGVDPLLGDSQLWSWAVVGAAAAWAVNPGPRGILGGRARFTAYGVCLSVEGLTRIICCLLAELVPAAAEPLLALALVAPLVASAAYGWWQLRDETVPDAPLVPAATGSEQTAFTAVALSIQLVLNTAPLVLQWHATNPAVAGQYVSAMTYMRIPMLLTSGFLPVALSHASTAYARRDRAGLTAATRHYTVLGSGLVVVLTLAALVVSGPALQLYYGGVLPVAGSVLVLLGLTTVLMVIANILTQTVLAAQAASAATLLWVATALITIVLLLLAGPSLLLVTLVVVVGLVIATVGIAMLAARSIRSLPVAGALP